MVDLLYRIVLSHLMDLFSDGLRLCIFCARTFQDNRRPIRT